MADLETLRNLEAGEEVTVITKGQYQIVDVAGGLRFPPLTECTTLLTPFVMNALFTGQLMLTSDEGAPKAEGEKSLSGDDLKYNDGSMPAAEKQLAPRMSKEDAEKTPAAEEQEAATADAQNSSTGNEALTTSSAEPAPARGSRRGSGKAAE